jgi:hypothetical protein
VQVAEPPLVVKNRHIYTRFAPDLHLTTPDGGAVQVAEPPFAPGNTYVVELRGTAAGLQGATARGVTVNLPPAGGAFSACLLPAGGGGGEAAGCVAAGLAVVDVFRLECESWADPEGGVPLAYRFGYRLLGGGGGEDVWFDWAPAALKDVSLPAGDVLAMAQVRGGTGRD